LHVEIAWKRERELQIVRNGRDHVVEVGVEQPLHLLGALHVRVAAATCRAQLAREGGVESEEHSIKAEANASIRAALYRGCKRRWALHVRVGVAAGEKHHATKALVIRELALRKRECIGEAALHVCGAACGETLDVCLEGSAIARRARCAE